MKLRKRRNVVVAHRDGYAREDRLELTIGRLRVWLRLGKRY